MEELYFTSIYKSCDKLFWLFQMSSG